MKINVKMADEFNILTDTRIEASDLNVEKHKHRSGRDFTSEEVKNLKSAKLSPEAAKKASEEAKAKAKAEADKKAAEAAKKVADAK